MRETLDLRLTNGYGGIDAIVEGLFNRWSNTLITVAKPLMIPIS